MPPRYALVGRISHILVDEYQDIDAEQYELVALLAGKTLEEKDQKMTILAVGDDDQNIYRFRGANVAFIRKFHEDYQAQIHYLVENYRSTAQHHRGGKCSYQSQQRSDEDRAVSSGKSGQNFAAGRWQPGAE